MTININNGGVGGGGSSYTTSTANLVPYTGAVSDLLLGTKKLSANAITCGTLQGVVISTGGSFSAVATGATGTFLAHAGGNTYSWANTSGSVGLGTDTLVPYLGAVSDVNLGSYDMFAEVISATTIKASTLSSTTLNASIISGGTVKATAITCGTLQGLIAGTAGTLFAVSTGGAGKFLYDVGNNTYAWADTSSVGGLGTDVVVPYLNCVSDLNMGSFDIFAEVISATTIKASTFTGTTFNATTFTGNNLSIGTITCGTLQGIITGTGGTFGAIATGGTNQFLYHAGNNTYAYADTQASLPVATTGKVSGLLPVTTDTTRYVLGGALELSLNTANIWATTFSGTNFYGGTFSGGTLKATTVSGTTLYAVTHSGTTVLATTLSGGTLIADGITSGTLQGLIAGTGGAFFAVATGGVGKFLYDVGNNTYAWANTSASGGLGTDVVVPYLNCVSDLLLGSFKLSANAITCGTLQGVVISTGGSFSAVATGATGAFLAHAGNNTYTWANTSGSAGLGTDTLVPYINAISALVLGQNFSASAITCGTLQGLIAGTGGTLFAVATGGAGKFLYDVGNNTYAWANTAAQAGLGTDVIVPYLGAVSDVNLGSYDMFAEIISATTIKASTMSGTTFNASVISGGTLKATGITAGTLQGVLFGTGGAFSAVATGAVGTFLSHSGGNVYAWSNTSSVGGLGTDVIVPYLNCVSDLNMGSFDIFAEIISATTIKASTVTGTTFNATTFTGNNLAVGTITCGTFQGVVYGTGGTFVALATGGVGQFLYHAGNNTYAYADTSSVGGLGTDVVVPYINCVSDVNLGSFDLFADVISANTIKASTVTGTTFNATTFSGGTVQAGTISGSVLHATTVSGTTHYATTYSGATVLVTTTSAGTVLATTLSGTNGYIATVSAGTVYSTNCSATTLKATTTTATNAYATTMWATTHSATNFYGSIISGNAVRATTVSGTTFYATTLSGTNLYAATTSVGTSKATTFSGTTLYVGTTSATTTRATVVSAGTLRAGAITCGTLQGVLFGTAGTFKAIATGGVGTFLSHSGGNIYAWANTSAVGGLGTDVVVPYINAVSALILGKNFSCLGITAGTLQGVTYGTGGTLVALATGAVGTFLTHAGNNTYAWMNTAAQAGLGTDVIVPYVGAVSDINLGSYGITANAFSATSTGNTIFNGTVEFATYGSGGYFTADGMTSTTLEATTVTCSSFYATSTAMIRVAANPILTIPGQIAIDSTTTSGSAFRFYSDAEYCLPGYQSKSFCLIDPAGTGTYQLWRTPYTYTIKTVYALVTGGSVTGALYKADGNGINCVAVTNAGAITAGSTTACVVASGVVSSGCFLNWISTATGATPSRLSVTFNYAVSSNA